MLQTPEQPVYTRKDITHSDKLYHILSGQFCLPANSINLIRKYKTEQQRYRLSLGTYWKGSNYLFIQDDGKQMDISTPNKVFKKVIRIYNETHEDKLPEITLHGLRHTSATLLIAQNVDVKTVSNRL